MKKLLLAVSFTVVSLIAADYTQMSLNELIALKENVPAKEKEAVQSEIQARILMMTPEEQASFEESNKIIKTSAATLY